MSHDFDFKTFLINQRREGTRLVGSCKNCNKTVPWSSAKLQEHKRGKACIGQSEEERIYFIKRFKESKEEKCIITTSSLSQDSAPSSMNLILDLGSSSNVSSQLTASDFNNSPDIHTVITSPSNKKVVAFMDHMTEADREKCDELLSLFAFRTAVPFHIFDSAVFLNFMSHIRPVYKPPSAKVLSGRLLDSCYNTIHDKVRKLIASTPTLSIVSDGWSNIRQDHLVNFLILVPGH